MAVGHDAAADVVCVGVEAVSEEAIALGDPTVRGAIVKDLMGKEMGMMGVKTERIRSTGILYLEMGAVGALFCPTRAVDEPRGAVGKIRTYWVKSGNGGEAEMGVVVLIGRGKVGNGMCCSLCGETASM